jgi:predicted TIM-barrel fold metal-dependent hydrolase
MDPDNKLMNQMYQGLPLDSVLILDAHAHLFDTAEDLIDIADRLGIDKLFLQVPFVTGSGEAEYYRALQHYPDHFIGSVGGVNPWYPDEILSRLDELFDDRGCITLGEQGPSYFDYPVTGPNYRTVWEYAEKKGCIVSVHSDHRNYPVAAPLEVAEVARQYPDLPIGIVHCGIDTPDGLDESIQAAMACDNIFLEISSVNARFGALERLVDKVGADRIIYGSDCGAIHMCSDLANVVFARISDGAKESILGLNLARLLKLEPNMLRRKSPK